VVGARIAGGRAIDVSRLCPKGRPLSPALAETARPGVPSKLCIAARGVCHSEDASAHRGRSRAALRAESRSITHTAALGDIAACALAKKTQRAAKRTAYCAPPAA